MSNIPLVGPVLAGMSASNYPGSPRWIGQQFQSNEPQVPRPVQSPESFMRNSTLGWIYEDADRRRQERQRELNRQLFDTTYQTFRSVRNPQITELDQQIGILHDRAAIDNQHYDEQYGFANRGYAIDQRGLDIDERRIGGQRKHLGTQRGLAGQLFDAQGRLIGLRKDDVGREKDWRLQQATDDSAARGASGSMGTGRTYKYIADTAASDLAKLDSERRFQDIDYRRTLADLAQKDFLLDIEAQQIGVSRERLQLALDKSLEELRFRNLRSINDINMAISSRDQQKQALGVQAYEQALGYASSKGWI